jgi:hypothetical protein
MTEISTDYAVLHGDGRVTVRVDGHAFLNEGSARAEAERFDAQDECEECDSRERHLVVCRPVTAHRWRAVPDAASRPRPDSEVVQVVAYGDELLHLHGKALSGLRHSHPLKPGENRDAPWHDHEGEWDRSLAGSDEDPRGVGAALYFADRSDAS